MTNHVIMRSFGPLQQFWKRPARVTAQNGYRAPYAQESGRIDHALDLLQQICWALEAWRLSGYGHQIAGSLARPGQRPRSVHRRGSAKVVELMSAHFDATLADRSWGDRLANKWNFVVPGLPELVEVHAGRLGQTGEQTAVTRSLSSRTCATQLHGHLFRVPDARRSYCDQHAAAYVPAFLYPALRRRGQRPASGCAPR